ncbi:MAG: hypothetical protein JWN19_3344, partial [Arthrobacter sp.]|nr:hypothetical protein [Arthrobacter sp.]
MEATLWYVRGMAIEAGVVLHRVPGHQDPLPPERRKPPES